MQLVYMPASYPGDPHIMIQATLDAGETLGKHTGPETLYVPLDPPNAEYADILARGLTIEPAPPPP